MPSIERPARSSSATAWLSGSAMAPCSSPGPACSGRPTSGWAGSGVEGGGDGRACAVVVRIINIRLRPWWVWSLFTLYFTTKLMLLSCIKY